MQQVRAVRATAHALVLPPSPKPSCGGGANPFLPGQFIKMPVRRRRGICFHLRRGFGGRGGGQGAECQNKDRPHPFLLPQAKGMRSVGRWFGAGRVANSVVGKS